MAYQLTLNFYDRYFSKFEKERKEQKRLQQLQFEEERSRQLQQQLAQQREAQQQLAEQQQQHEGIDHTLLPHQQSTSAFLDILREQNKRHEFTAAQSSDEMMIINDEKQLQQLSGEHPHKHHATERAELYVPPLFGTVAYAPLLHEVDALEAKLQAAKSLLPASTHANNCSFERSQVETCYELHMGGDTRACADLVKQFAKCAKKH
eukprot:GEZU01036253.1.p1 GENE.GEZU01036253.1~~GEZU01036253.1.p1  ORF type:complete len:206 (-),score=53.91 GEZU01036253.1:157-774(-)